MTESPDVTQMEFFVMALAFPNNAHLSLLIPSAVDVKTDQNTRADN